MIRARQLVSLLTQHLSLNSGVSLHPFSRLAMSSPPTTPTVSSATPSTSFSTSATPSQSTDNNGGPSSSLYLYAILLLQNHKPLPIMFAHFLFLSVISRAHASRLAPLLSTSERMISLIQVHLPRDAILIVIRLVRDYTSIFHPPSSVQETYRRGYPCGRHTSSTDWPREPPSCHWRETQVVGGARVPHVR